MKNISSSKKLTLKNKLLILVAGYPGTGKTYLAHKLIRKIQIVYIDKDEIDDVFSTSRLSPAYQKFKPYVHKIMYAVASINLMLGNSVVIDAPFTSKYMGNKDWLKFIKDFAKKHNVIIKVIWCESSTNTRKARLLKRAHGRDTERKHQIDEFIGKAKKFDIPFEHLYVDTKKLNWKKIFKFLK